MKGNTAMKQFDAQEFGARLCRRRLEYGLTQKEMADSIGLSISFYGHIERGTRIPSLPVLILLANRLHIGCDSLLRDSLEAPCLPKVQWTDREIGILRQMFEEHGASIDDWFSEAAEEKQK